MCNIKCNSEYIVAFTSKLFYFRNIRYCQLILENISVTIVLSTSYEVKLACTLTGLGMHNEHDKFTSLCKVILIVKVDKLTYSILYGSTYILKSRKSIL